MGIPAVSLGVGRSQHVNSGGGIPSLLLHVIPCSYSSSIIPLHCYEESLIIYCMDYFRIALRIKTILQRTMYYIKLFLRIKDRTKILMVLVAGTDRLRGLKDASAVMARTVRTARTAAHGVEWFQCWNLQPPLFPVSPRYLLL